MADKNNHNLWGSALLKTALYWAFVYHTGWWAVGISAYAVAFALNVGHLYIRREVK